MRPWVSHGFENLGGVFEATETILTTSIVMKFSHGPWSLWTPKSPLGTHIFGEFFWTLFYETFYGEQSLFYGICCANRRKVLFLRFLKKKLKNLPFWMISPNNHVHTGHFIITKFYQDAKKTILVKV